MIIIKIIILYFIQITHTDHFPSAGTRLVIIVADGLVGTRRGACPRTATPGRERRDAQTVRPGCERLPPLADRDQVCSYAAFVGSPRKPVLEFEFVVRELSNVLEVHFMFLKFISCS